VSPNASAPLAKASLVGANTVTFAPGSESPCMHCRACPAASVDARAVIRRPRTHLLGGCSLRINLNQPRRAAVSVSTPAHLLQLGGGEGLGECSQLEVLLDCLQSGRLAAVAASNDPAALGQATSRWLWPNLDVTLLDQSVPAHQQGCNAMVYLPGEDAGSAVAGGVAGGEGASDAAARSKALAGRFGPAAAGEGACSSGDSGMMSSKGAGSGAGGASGGAGCCSAEAPGGAGASSAAGGPPSRLADRSGK
jgi:hypothetical protein